MNLSCNLLLLLAHIVRHCVCLCVCMCRGLFSCVIQISVCHTCKSQLCLHTTLQSGLQRKHVMQVVKEKQTRHMKKLSMLSLTFTLNVTGTYSHTRATRTAHSSGPCWNSGRCRSAALVIYMSCDTLLAALLHSDNTSVEACMHSYI